MTRGPPARFRPKPLYDAYAIVSARATNAIRSISTFPNARSAEIGRHRGSRIVPERLDAHKLTEFMILATSPRPKCLKEALRLSTGCTMSRRLRRFITSRNS